ncbi:MAG: GNAT family protein [Bacteroidota bacterium]
MHSFFRIDEHLELRTWSQDDGPALLELILANEAYLRQWLPWLDFRRTPDQVRNYINQAQMATIGKGDRYFGIWNAGKMVGEISHHDGDRIHRRAKLSYWLGEGFQGKGIVTRSCEALVQDLFLKQNLNRLELRVAAGNLPSQRVAERLNFVQEGQLRQVEWLYDRFVDHLVYGRLSADFLDGEKRG